MRASKPPQILVRVTGGLGNQLFQYAAGVALADRLCGQLKMDPGAYASEHLRRYRLDELLDPPDRVSAEDLQELLAPGWISRNVLRRRPIRVIKHHEASFRPEVLAIDHSCYLDGYWQSERYFAAIRQGLRDRIRFRGESHGAHGLEARAASERIASVHIRRGDYVQVNALRDWHGVLPLEYYEEGLRLLDKRFALQGVFVFTDDPEWAAEQFRTHLPTTIVSQPGADELRDLAVMRACHYHVIANSSFSWWGAWLSAAEPQAVVAPRRWFATPLEDASAIVPPGWNLV